MKKSLYTLILVFFYNSALSQIKNEGMVEFWTSDFFNITVECQAYYHIYEDHVLVRFQDGSIRKNPKYEGDQILSSIRVSLTKYELTGKWNTIFHSQEILLGEYTLTEENPLDISYIPEGQLFEFIIPFDSGFKFDQVGLTITIVDPKNHTRYAHAAFLREN